MSSKCHIIQIDKCTIFASLVKILSSLLTEPILLQCIKK